jgi:hypothetical protein
MPRRRPPHLYVPAQNSLLGILLAVCSIRSRFTGGIAHGVLDVAVAEIGLQGARIVSLVGKGEATGVPQHMRVSLEAQAGALTSALDHAGKAGGREGRAALGPEHERRLGLLLALKPSQGPQSSQFRVKSSSLWSLGFRVWVCIW